jgi:hypothetical protein
LHAAEQGIRAGLPAGGESSDPQRLAQLFAQEEGIDLNERFGEAVPSQKQVDALRMEMPEVESAYQPSGALPASAVLLLLLGSVVGCVGGAIAGTVIAGAGLALSGALVHANSGFSGLAILHALIVIAALLGALLAMGYVSAWCTTQFGQWGKNRNIVVAMVLAVLASVVPVFCACGCYFRFGAEPLLNKLVMDHRLSPLLWVWLWEPGFVISAVFGALIAALTAGGVAAYRVQAVKFCESRQTSMGSCSKTLSLGCVRAFVRALRKVRMDVAESLLQGASGWEGEACLYFCPSCSRGYLEVTVKHKVRVEGGSPYVLPREVIESCLVVSRELNANDVERLRPLLERDGSQPANHGRKGAHWRRQ